MRQNNLTKEEVTDSNIPYFHHFTLESIQTMRLCSSFTLEDKFPLAAFSALVGKTTSLEDKIRPVYLIAVLVVLEACVVVHKAVEFLKALVFFLCLQNHEETEVTIKLLSMLFLTEET